MRVDSLERLSAAVVEWRSEKKNEREKMPEWLLERARLAAKTHGLGTVVRVLRVDRRRLEAVVSSGVAVVDKVRGHGADAGPAYSRVELAGVGAHTSAFAELELPSGTKLRLYTDSPATVGLLAQVCGAGGAR